MKANESEAIEMALEFIRGRIKHVTKVIEKTIEPMEKGNFFIWMAMCLMAIGSTTKRVALEYTSM